MYCAKTFMLSEKLFLPQVPQPIESEKGSPLSKLPPVAKVCACLTMTRATVSSWASLRMCASFSV